MKKTAILYIRVSTDEQAREGYSLEAQEANLKKFCQDKDIEVFALFQDDFTGKTFQRPGFQRALSYVKKNRRVIDYFLFTKWDRFGRNIVESYAMIDQMEKMGVETQAVEQWIDFSIPQNKFLLAIYITQPEVNNDVRAAATKDGLRRIKEKGGWVVNAIMGYDCHRNEDRLPTMKPNGKARWIKKAYEMAAEGSPHKEIRRILRANGLNMGKNHLTKLLKNRVYLGEVYLPEYKKESARWIEGLHPAIVDEYLFNRVQRSLAGNKRHGRRYEAVPEFPLRGHLQCQQCGTPLTGSASRSHTGKRYFYYHCQHGCTERHPAHEINESFASYLRRIKPAEGTIQLYRAVITDLFQQKGNDMKKGEQEIAKEIEGIKKKQFRANELLLDDKLPLEQYETMMGHYRKSLANLEQEKEELVQLDEGWQEGFEFSFELVQNMDHFFEWADLETKNTFMGSIFPQKVIYLGDGCYRTPKANRIIALYCGLEPNFEVAKLEKGTFYSAFLERGTQERSRTFTSLRTLRPERSASTNSATWAIQGGKYSFFFPLPPNYSHTFS